MVYKFYLAYVVNGNFKMEMEIFAFRGHNLPGIGLFEKFRGRKRLHAQKHFFTRECFYKLGRKEK